MIQRDDAHELIDEVRELENGDTLDFGTVNILQVPYRLTITQPRPGRFLSLLGLQPKPKVEIVLPNKKQKSFPIDPTGPKHDASDELRRHLFTIHRELYSAVN